MPRFQRLREHVSGLEPEHVYRTIYDENLNPVIEGTEPLDPQGLQDFRKVDFTGKSVVDLGCNFGFFSFQARRLGAASVTGVDRESRVLEGAAMLREIFGLDGVEFVSCDIDVPLNCLCGRKFDTAMLVEFIGKTFVREGLIPRSLAFLETLSDTELVLSVQKTYMIRKELGSTVEEMRRHYPDRYLEDGDILVLDFVRDFFKDRWDIEMLSDIGDGYEKPRKYMRLRK
ncbi:methyltransferase domain-containing protein [Fundidesulfovibrio terrae]|uniref:methyltransferase domain-containing protein n=1 Tax=Fundidesulfovibrio terrae TaxID=2922866 RepID=UPI001FAF186B|nr:methyltransferase domain-containing protein [Fundidesulfovibrio terrae]